MNGLISFDNLYLKPVDDEILSLNEISAPHGLLLSKEEAHELSQMRSKALEENERIEMGTGVVTDLIKHFCASRYITQENYAYILNELTYLFYYIKTETDDGISDRDLIKELFERFELYCRGSIDMLENREVERIIRKVNSGDNYYKWYRERDELDYTGTEGSREAPVEYDTDGDPHQARAAKISSYDEEVFNDDTPADHDMYEEDFDMNGDHWEEESAIDLDAFDEFFDLEAVMNDDDNTNNTLEEDDDHE